MSQKAKQREELHRRIKERQEEEKRRNAEIEAENHCKEVLISESFKPHNDPHYGKYLQMQKDVRYGFSARRFLMEQSYSTLKSIYSRCRN